MLPSPTVSVSASVRHRPCIVRTDGQGYTRIHQKRANPLESNKRPHSADQRTPGARRAYAIYLGLFGVALAVGVWARFSGLGFSSLAADEYYFVESIRRIIATGLPAFETGGYYTRGILIQYLTVPAMWVSATVESGVRLPSVVFGLFTAFVAYLYGHRTIGRPWGVALAAMILLSSWEVEFSRFGRMYAGFQLATLAALVSLHDVIGGVRGMRRYLPLVLGLVLVATHSLAIFLLPLLYLPVVLPGRVDRLGGRKAVCWYLLAATIPTTAALILRGVNFRMLGVQNAFPADFSSSGGMRVVYPAFPFWQLGTPLASLAGLATLLGLVALSGWVLERRRKIDEATTVAAVCLAAAAAHSLLLAGILGLILAARYGLPRTARMHPLAMKLGLAAALVSVGWVAYAGWVTYGAGSRGWIEATGVHLFRDAALRAFVWPDPSASVLDPWLHEFPLMARFLAVAFLIQFVTKVRDPLHDIVRNPAFVVAYLLALLGFFAPQFVVARYTYFVYPVVLAMLILSVRDIVHFAGQRLSFVRSDVMIGVLFALALFAVGGDFHPRHLARVASYESTYRTGVFQAYEITWYDRDDHAATAAYVADAAEPQDLVIVAEVPVVSHYLLREHAVYLDQRGSRFRNVSREHGTVDVWSNRRLLGTPNELRDFTRCTEQAVWIVQSLDEKRWLQPLEVWGPQIREVETKYVSPDQSLEVVRVSLHHDPDCFGAADG